MSDYRFNLDLSNEHYTIKIDTRAQYGYFENNKSGTGGGIWFDGKTIVDYDGVFDLPKQVYERLYSAGFAMEAI